MLGRKEKEWIRIATEVMAEHVKSGDGIAEAMSDVFGALPLDEEGTEGFVLALLGRLRLEKEAANSTYLFWCSQYHIVTLSHSPCGVKRKLRLPPLCPFDGQKTHFLATAVVSQAKQDPM